MKIVYYDGSELACTTIEIVDDGTTLIVDEYRIVPIAEVQRIIQD